MIFQNYPPDAMHLISLGAGTQSSTVALQAAAGEITPMPVAAIFADTGWEPAQVYTWLDWLEQQLPFPVHRVSAGNIRKDQVKARVRGTAVNGERFASLPLYTMLEGALREGKVRRQCTNEYKIEPISKKVRELLGLKFRQRAPKDVRVVQWIGISRDEAQRMKPSRERYILHRWPLIEAGMTRQDCVRWIEDRYGRTPPRSSCIGCPFHSDMEWREMRDHRPDEWADAVEFDHAIRKAGGPRGDTFLHRSCKPLDQVDLSNAEDHGQMDLFGNDCTGMCGV